jgi:hypothetical protein
MKTKISIVAGLLLGLLSIPAIADWQVIYSEDFSSDPGWTTDDSAKLGWDSASGTYHGRQVNTEGTYAFKKVEGIDFSKAWRFEFDSIVNSNQWSAGLTIGLFDSQLQFPYGNIIDFGTSDNGQCIQLRNGPVSEVWTNSPAWSTGTRYHSVMEYNPIAQQVTAVISNRDTGEFFLSLTSNGVLFSGDAK